MSEIELVIKIPEEIYLNYKKVWQKRRGSIPESCIAFGIPLPKGHGRLIDADKLPYEDVECTDGKTYMVVNAYDVEYADTIIEANKEESVNKNE